MKSQLKRERQEEEDASRSKKIKKPKAKDSMHPLSLATTQLPKIQTPKMTILPSKSKTIKAKILVHHLECHYHHIHQTKSQLLQNTKLIHLASPAKSKPNFLSAAKGYSSISCLSLV